jgi:hypothetical protein
MQAINSTLNFTRTAIVDIPAHKEISVPAQPTQFGDNLLTEAVRDGWNMEMDWLWLATKVSIDAHRRYCLERALKINPNSEMAMLGLRQLRVRPGLNITF